LKARKLKIVAHSLRPLLPGGYQRCEHSRNWGLQTSHTEKIISLDNDAETSDIIDTLLVHTILQLLILQSPKQW